MERGFLEELVFEPGLVGKASTSTLPDEIQKDCAGALCCLASAMFVNIVCFVVFD